MKSKLVVAFLLPVALSAQTPTSPIAKGSMLVGGSASLSLVDDDGGSDAVLSVSVLPNVLFFAANRFAIGGQLGLTYSSSDDFSATGWALGPAFRYFIAEPSAKTLPFVGASFTIGRTTISAGTGPNVNLSTTGFEGVAGITWLLVPHVGFDGELFARRATFESSGGGVPVTSENTQTAFGLRFGISAFVF
jgi:hypothetical protein